ncbi:MAG: tetratricopeptide repeat protein, partial [Marinicella sp.]
MSQIEDIKTLHNQGQFEAAIKGYQELLNDDPNNDEAHFGLAHANSRINDLEQALVHAKEAVKLVPNSDRYQQFKGQMLLANRHIDDALKAFKRSLKENPNLFFSYVAVGDIYAIKNESQKAKENYHLALKVHSDGIPAIIKLSKLMLLEGDYAAATDQLQEAELQYPADPQVKLQMGIMKLEQGEDGFAELYFKKLLEDEPNNQVAKAYLAISLLNSDPEHASELIGEMLNEKIQLPELMAALGLLYAKSNNHQDAIRYLTPVCQSGLAYPSWLMALAQAYAGNLQPNSAMAVLNEILKRGDNPRALMMLGQIHQVNANFPVAIKTYQRINKDSPFYDQSLIMQAECQYSAGEFQDTIHKLDPILAQKQDHNTAIKLKLNACSQLGQYDEALALIESIDPDKQVKEFNQLMHLYAGLLFDAKADYEQAWQHFSVIEPPQPKALNLLSAEDEKKVQNYPSQPANSVFRFVFTDPATGHHDFLNWLLNNEVTPLIDRFTTK